MYLVVHQERNSRKTPRERSHGQFTSFKYIYRSSIDRVQSSNVFPFVLQWSVVSDGIVLSSISSASTVVGYISRPTRTSVKLLYTSTLPNLPRISLMYQSCSISYIYSIGIPGFLPKTSRLLVPFRVIEDAELYTSGQTNSCQLLTFYR